MLNKKVRRIFMFEKLDAIEKRFEELTKKISDPDVIANQSEWRELMKEHAEMEMNFLKKLVEVERRRG